MTVGRTIKCLKGRHPMHRQAARWNPAFACVVGLFYLLAAEGRGEGTNVPVRTVVLTLDQVMAVALEHNPALVAARLRAEAARDRPAREGALPNPMIGVSAEEPTSDFRPGGVGMTRLEFEQALPGLGKRSLRQRMAESDAEAARLAEAEKRLDLKLDVTETAYGLDAASKAVALILSEVELLKQLDGIIRARYATGSVDQQDAVKAQAEVTLMQQRLIDARSRVTSLKARLNSLMGRDVATDLGEVLVSPPPAWPQPDLSNWLARAESDNPGLIKARVMVDRARLEERLMRRGFQPDLKLKAELTRDQTADETYALLGIGVELPLQVAATRAGIREAGNGAQAAEWEREALRREAEYNIQDIASCCAAASQNLDLLKAQLLPQAEARYKASEGAYAAGKSDFLDLLESQRFRLTVRMMALTTEAEVATQLARLERLLGGPVSKVDGGHK